MRFRKIQTYVTLCALWGLSIGCEKRAAVVALDVLPPDSPTFALNLDEAKKDARELVSKLNGFVLRPARAGESQWQLTIWVRMTSERRDDREPQKVRRAIGLEAELREVSSDTRLTAEALEVRVVRSSAPSDAHMRKTLERVFSRLGISARLARAQAGPLIKALEGDDAFAQAVAIQVIKDRRVIETREALERLLNRDTLSTPGALRVASALEVIGDERSSSSIIDTISKHRSAAIPLIFLLGRIGGRQAQAYLFTVKSGHSNPKVRAAAEEVLKSLDAKNP